MGEVDTSELFDSVSWGIFDSPDYKRVEEKAFQRVKNLLDIESEPYLSPEQEKQIDEIVTEAEMELKKTGELQR